MNHKRGAGVRTASSWAAIVAVLWLGTIAATSAQTYQGGLRGQVQDQQGVIPGAEVVLTNEETGSARTVVSNEVGEYALPSVLPGSYTVSVSLPGFKTGERKNLRIGTQQTVVADFTLEVGTISEQIVVTGEAALVERASATVSSSLDKDALQALPIFGRNTFYAAISTPGVIQSGDPQFVRYQDQSGSSQLSLGGGPRRGNAYLLEGIAITDLVNRATIVPSMEAVEELKVQVKTYDADMGRAAGGVFNTTARSGSNNWHGGAVLVTKPGFSTGTLYFAKKAGIPNPPQYYYNWAGSVGGPIVKNKTFFWFSTDDYQQKSTRNSVLPLPTALERAGNFSQTTSGGRPVILYDPLTTRPDPANPGQFIRDPFPGNVIPANRISPIAAAMLKALPLPTSGKSFNGNASLLDGPQNQETIKVDQRWSDTWTTTGMYAHQHTQEPGSAYFGEFGTVPGDPGASNLLRTVDFFALNNIFVPTNTTVISVRYGMNHFLDDGGNYPAFDAASLGLPASYVSSMSFNTFPQALITGYGGNAASSTAATLGNGGPNTVTHKTQTANATVSQLMGHHTVKFGGEYRRIGADVRSFGSSAGTFTFTQGFTQGPNTNAASVVAGDAFASFLLGYASTGSIVAATPASYLLDYYGAYVQDEYRMTSKLSVNFGLRYEYEQGLREKDNHVTVGFDPDAVFPATVPGMSLKGGLMYAGENGYSTHQGQALNGFAPRGGFAWTLGDGSVVRGGYGFFWSPVQMSGLGEAAIGSRGYTASTSFLGSTDGGLTPANTLSNPFPTGITPPQGNSLGVGTGGGSVIDFVDQNSRPGYVQQYSVDLQKELPGNIMVSAGYMGSRSEHLTVGGTTDATININQLDPQYLSLGTALQQQVPNPFFGIAALGNLGRSATIPRGQLLRPYPQFDNVFAHRVTDARSRYDALLLRWEKRVRNGWGASVNYTFSRMMDSQFGEGNTFSRAQGGIVNNYDIDAEYGQSLLDVPHRLNFTGTLQLPFGEGRKWLTSGVGNAVLGGWSVTMAGRYQNGFPISVSQASNNSGLLGSGQRPNLVPGVDPATSGSTEERLSGWINPAAFTAAPAFTIGDAPRTIPGLRTPGQANTDLSVQKAVRFGSKSLSIRADVLNLLDNPLFLGPITTFGTATFGQITTVGGYARSVQFQARVGF